MGRGILGVVMKRILITGSGGPAGVNFINSLREAPEKMFLVGLRKLVQVGAELL